MIRTTIISILIVTIVALSVFLLVRKPAEENQQVVSGETDAVIANSSNTHPDIKVISPKLSENIGQGSFVVKGEARLWYFEGSFPVKLYDVTGTLVGMGPATAQGEWMTTEFVPFEGTIQISPNAKEGEGYILFSEDNPAGDEERGRPIKTYKVPVYIPKQNTMNVLVYFGTHETVKNNCAEVIPVTRTVAKSESIARTAILELLKGVQSNEYGYVTGIPESATLNSISITNGIARVDMSGISGGGSCAVGMIRSQIEMTLKQFTTVEKVEVFINGKSDILEP